MARSIPSRPSLEKDRKQAKALRKGHASADPEALARIREHHPRFSGLSDADVAASRFGLADAQLVIAREYGVESWPRLLALFAFLRADYDERARLFLEAALKDDSRPAHELLSRAPELARADIHTACAAVDEKAVLALLARDPGHATRSGGPCEAGPLFTLAWSNLDLADARSAEARVQIALALLRAGADANARATKDSDYGPFEASTLYGAVHRNQPGLVKVLLEAGADPNDGESMYHATEHRDGGCLAQLLAHGGNPNDVNVLKHALDYPQPDMVRTLLEHGADPNRAFDPRMENGLHHAARRGRGGDVLALLLEHGGDPEARSGEGYTPFEIARRCGNAEAAETLRAHGASDAIEGDELFVVACAAADEPRVREMLKREAGRVERLAERDLALLPEAARQGHTDAVRVMLDAGFPLETTGGDYAATALNHAAFAGRPLTLELLLERGADPEIENAFGGTALGALAWAWSHPDGVDDRPADERREALLRCAKILIAAGAEIRPTHLANATPPLSDLLRHHGAPEIAN